MTATIYTLNIHQKNPEEALREGIVKHVCGGALFRLTVEGNVYCARCSEAVSSLEVKDRSETVDSAA
ncbi:MAG: hypothetical protein AAFO57_00420 [Pseudomonadota bacterium]